jgi:hemerythrin-like domain-containing protein
MKPSEIRVELLREHAALRATLRDATSAAERWLRGEPARDAVHGVLSRLASQMRAHNIHEEALLRDVMPTADAWGPVRAEIMLEEHEREHAELSAAIDEARTTADMDLAVRAISAFVERLTAHMDREEKLLLSEDLLCDDISPVRDYLGA